VATAALSTITGMDEYDKQPAGAIVRSRPRSGHTWALISLIVGFLIPSTTIFFLDVFIGLKTPKSAWEDILGRQFAAGENLFLLALYGLFPFAVLGVVCRRAARRLSPVRVACLAVGGLIGVANFMIAAHAAVWYPLYSGGHMASTAVIAFVFIPFLCLGPLAIGLFAGWAVSLIFRQQDKPAATNASANGEVPRPHPLDR
jgi:hypothetical protein